MKKAIFGFGGHARELLCQISKAVCFVDDKYYKKEKNTLPISKFDPQKYKLIIGIGDSIERKKIAEKLPKETKYFSFIHPTAQILGSKVKIGVGSFIGANCIITDNVTMGNHCLLNRGNQIGHDCVIGNYFSMMPGSIVSGECVIANCVYIGTNSSIREKISICKNVKIGLNSGVVKNIKRSGIYAGLPAKYIKNI
jgi:sugar O-acyltransferase (sialic acid O-acetyltransferase NeuD family)